MDMRNMDKLFTKEYIRFCYSVNHYFGGCDVLGILSDPFVQKAFSYSEDCKFDAIWTAQQLRLTPDQRMRL